MVDNPVIPMLNHPDAAPSCTVFGDRLIPRQQPLHSLDKARTRAFLMEFGSPRLHLPSAMEHASFVSLFEERNPTGEQPDLKKELREEHSAAPETIASQDAPPLIWSSCFIET